MPDDDRKAYLMPHWENWLWQDTKPVQFGDISVALSADNSTIAGVTQKALLMSNLHMGAAALTTADTKSGGVIVMTLHGLSAGEHTLATYHHEFRKGVATAYQISVDGKTVVAKVTPSHEATSDYDLGSSYFKFNAEAAKDVEVRIRPLDARAGSVLNGFEIDTPDPHKRAIKPLPENDDEHVDPKTSITWTAPVAAKAHFFYFGTDAEAVARATPQSPEFKGQLQQAKFPLPPVDHMKTYFWRVDESDGKSAAPIKGEVWHFRSRFLAFPTAEGYGRFARGGRGGRVIEVTTLEDNESGPAIPGSYRAAIEAEGPRTIVFRVSGLIQLKRPCIIRNGDVTVAGQTAPGDGICLSNYSAGMATHDAIVRFLRVRVGDTSRKAMDGMGLGPSDDSIIDHCSISWAMDEGTSSRGGHNITFQWNIISEMLQHGYHYSASDRNAFETHAFAGSISGDIGSYHHNLLAHCTDRNWSLAGGLDQAAMYAGRLDIRNNVVYNWTARTTDGGVKELNYVNNYYKPYAKQKYVNWLLKLDPINPNWGTEKYFMVGNVMEGFHYDKDNWLAFFNGKNVERQVRVDRPLYPSFIKAESARDAYVRVVAGAGAVLPKRDVIDTRIAEEVRTGTVHYQGTKANEWKPGDKNGKNAPGIIDTQTDVHDADNSPFKPWPNYKTYNVPVDSDHDGMPDDWEKAHGLNPNDPEDRNGDFNGDGYTNLEKYLNSLTSEYTAKVK